MTDAKRATAIHEAGHAVAAWRQDLDFTTISIVPDDDSLGRVAMGALPDGFAPESEITLEDRDLIERKAVVSLAGDAAERHYLEQVGAQVDDALLADQATHDFASAVNITSYLFDHDDVHQAHLDYMVVRARVLVEANWHVIEALADAVTEAGSLTWPQAEPIVRAAYLRTDVKPAGTD